MLLLLRNLLFVVLIPGTVAVWIPYRILTGGPVPPRPAGGIPLLLAAVLAAAGVAVFAWCLWDFARHGRGTLAPVDPPRKLVVRGPYHFVRNPMYLGVLLVLLAEVVFFGSRALLLYALCWLAVVHLWVVVYEEPTLLRRFDGSYEEYRREVRRWIPRVPHRPAA